jgi:cytochrome c556
MRTAYRIAALSLAFATIAGTAIAQDPIGSRKAAMKTIGGSVGLLTKMVKGEEAYDSAKAKGAVDAIAKAAQGFDALFPAGSDQGDTKAGPKIWEDQAGFKAALAKLQEATGPAAEKAGKDVDGVKAALGALGATCKGCHETYRKS